MTAANSISNGPRGDTPSRPAVLVVGDQALARDVHHALDDARVERVEHFLMAIGHAAHNPVSAIIGHASALHDTAQSTARALKRLVPQARLILVADPESEPDARKAIEAGFDAYILEPVDASELLHAIHPASAPAAARPAPTPSLMVKPPAPVASPHATAATSPPPSPIAHLAIDIAPAPVIEKPVASPPAAASPVAAPPAAAPMSPRTPEAPAASVSASSPAPEPAAPPAPARSEYPLSGIDIGCTLDASPFTPALVADADLGDVDLVDQMLTDRRGTRDLLIRMITSRSGLPDVLLAAPGQPIAAGRLSSPVEHRGIVMGTLHAAPDADVQSLRSWAAWLGHWLAMDRRMADLWEAAFRDELTGVWNRRYFMRFLDEVLQRARADRFRVTLMMFDIDDFKTYNDQYGHAAGDEILREAARLMRSVVRDHDVVARIGGDEFVVIFWDRDGPRRPNSDHPTDVSLAAKRFRKAISEHRFPKLTEEARGRLTISGGLASFPWDGQTPDALLDVADRMAIQSKRQGKNVVTFGPGASQACNPDASLGGD